MNYSGIKIILHNADLPCQKATQPISGPSILSLQATSRILEDTVRVYYEQTINFTAVGSCFWKSRSAPEYTSVDLPAATTNLHPNRPRFSSVCFWAFLERGSLSADCPSIPPGFWAQSIPRNTVLSYRSRGLWASWAPQNSPALSCAILAICLLGGRVYI